MSELLWVVVRQDEGGNRYRVGRYASREEAERIAEALGERGQEQHYLIERIDR
jgi:hypothetical protein